VDVLAEGAAQHLLDVPDDVVEVQDFGLGDVASAEGEQLFGQPGGAFGGPAICPMSLRAPARSSALTVGVSRFSSSSSL